MTKVGPTGARVTRVGLSLREGASWAKVKSLIRVEGGRLIMGSLSRCCKVNDRSSEIMQNQDGESWAPKTKLMGIRRKASMMYALAAAKSGW